MDGIQVLVHKDTRLVVPTPLQAKIVQWYHHYLLHPGHTRLEETIAATLYWPSLRSDVRRYVKGCDRCQKGKKRKRQKYGHLPPKTAETIPWHAVCVDLIGPYTIKGKDVVVMDRREAKGPSSRDSGHVTARSNARVTPSRDGSFRLGSAQPWQPG